MTLHILALATERANVSHWPVLIEIETSGLISAQALPCSKKRRSMVRKRQGFNSNQILPPIYAGPLQFPIFIDGCELQSMSKAELLAKCRGLRDPELPWWRPVMGSKTRDQLMLFLAEKEMSMRSPRGTDMFFPKLWSVDLTGCTYDTPEKCRQGFCDR